MSRLVAFLLSLFAIASVPAAGERWSFGAFSMGIIPGFRYKEGTAPAIYTNAKGHAVLITVHLLDGFPSEAEAARLIERAKGMARSSFERGAVRYGRPLETLKESKLPSGDILVSLPVETRGPKGTGFLLQYGVISKRGSVSIVTVEGQGSAEAAATLIAPAIKGARFEA